MRTVVFVYNAASGFLNKYLDNAHKIISPGTYSCSLCSLTHGNFSEKKIWKDFRENTNNEFVFMYKNDFLNAYPDLEKYNFPVILQKEQDEFRVLLDSKEISSCTVVEDLIEAISKKTP